MLYNVSMKNLTFIISKSDKFLVASCAQEAIITQAKSFDSLIESIEEAVSLHFENVHSKIKTRSRKILSPYTGVYSNIVQNV